MDLILNLLNVLPKSIQLEAIDKIIEEGIEPDKKDKFAALLYARYLIDKKGVKLDQAIDEAKEFFNVIVE